MPKLVALQALRAAAALAVAVHHGLHEVALLTGADRPASRALPWEAGVDAFFVTSGFVMAWASGPLFAAPGGPRLFAARRVARVVPLYWLASGAFLAVALLAPGAVRGPAGDPGFVLASFLFWPAARPDGVVQPLYGLGWTLNYEALFYALFAGAVALPRRAAVAAVAAALLMLVAAGRALAPLSVPLAFWSDPIVLEFAFGMALGLARAEGVTLPDAARAALAAAGLALLAAAGPEASASGARFLLWGGPAALLVAAAALGRPRERGGAAMRAAAALGDASYAIYLVHPFVLRAWRGLAAPLAPGPVLILAIGLALTVAVALALHARVERPMTAWVRRALGGDAAPFTPRAGPRRPPPAPATR